MKEKILAELKEAVFDKLGRDCKIEYEEITKNNGLTLLGMVIKEPGSKQVPIIYINDYQDEIISENINIETAAEKIIDDYNKAVNYRFNNIPLNKLRILEKVEYQLINTSLNQQRLNDIPHKEFLDLSIVYNAVIDPDKNANMLITNEICRIYDIEIEELDKAAKENTRKKGFEVVCMGDFLKNSADLNMNIDNLPMWIFSSQDQLNGAAIILFNEYFSDLSETLDDDLYILPSSIHELLVIPKAQKMNAYDIQSLKEMVLSVNQTVLEETEILSYNIYEYNRKENLISIAE